jgi:hypothetical protein
MSKDKQVLRQTRPLLGLLRCNSTPYVLQVILQLCVEQ